MFDGLREKFHRMVAADLDGQARELQASAIWHRHKANNLAMRLIAKAALERASNPHATHDDD
jgi:hypothetical protein